MLAEWDGGLAFLFYAGINSVSLLFVWLFVPETKGKTLEELEECLTST
jgi:hypothetical protein